MDRERATEILLNNYKAIPPNLSMIVDAMEVFAKEETKRKRTKIAQLQEVVDVDAVVIDRKNKIIKELETELKMLRGWFCLECGDILTDEGNCAACNKHAQKN